MIIRASAFFVLMCASTASAQGAFDFADPCIQAGNEFNSSSAAARSGADAVIKDWDSRNEPPGELRGYYLEAVRTGLYQTWLKNPANAPLLDTIKSVDPNFDSKTFFLEKIYPQVVTAEIEADFIRQFFAADYQKNLRPKLISQREDIERQIASGKEKLDESCKSDVVSQVLRVTLGNAISLIGGRLEGAAAQSGELSKVFYLTSGISLDDMVKYGIQGGPNSVVNQVLGGESSALRGIVNALDVSKWKVDLDVKVESTPSGLPRVNIGDVGVCVPWC